MSEHPSDTTPPVGFVSDQPAAEDHLGVTAYVETLADVIYQSQPPLTIGVYGPDGSGKSFLLRLLEARLKDNTKAKSPLSEQILPPIFFEAYDHPVEVVGARLVDSVIRTLERELTTWDKVRLINRRNWRYYYQRVRGWFLLLLLAILVLEIIAAYWLINRQVQLDWITWLFVLGSGVLVTIVGFIQGIIKAARDVFEVEKTYRATAPRGFWGMASPTTAPDPRHEAAAIIDSIRRPLQGKKGVLLIDLSGEADKAKEMLDWVELLHAAGVFVVVVAMDPHAAAEAIDQRARQRESDLERIADAIEKLAGGQPRERRPIGPDYLDRRIHIPFYLPSSTLAARHEYVRYQFGDSVHIGQVALSVVVSATGSNPREIKRFVNRYRASAALLNRLGVMPDSDGLEKLARWIVFGTLWPGIMTLLLERLKDRQPSFMSAETPLRELLDDRTMSSLDTAEPEHINRLLNEEPSLRIQDYDRFLYYAMPFIADVAGGNVPA